MIECHERFGRDKRNVEVSTLSRLAQMGEASIGSDTYPPAVRLSDGVLISLDQPDSVSRPNRASLREPSWVKLPVFDPRTTVDHEVKRQ